jgi:hypothetical protein
MKTKSSLPAFVAALCASFVFAGSALAQSFTPTSDYGVLGSGTNYFYDSFDAANKAKSFTDNFTFQVLSASTFDLLKITFPGISNHTVGLFSVAPAGTHSYSLGTSIGTGKNDLKSVFLAPGVYDIQVTGTVRRNDEGYFAGKFSIAAVPEPGEWALILSGLGLLGVVVRRRTRQPA